MNVVREINKINERELELGVSGASWHDEYKDSAYVFAGGLHFELTEGDVITIFSQYGEIMDINMPRDKTTGKTRGFAFIMYEDQRSTILAVDNLNGAKVLEKTLRVDHVKDYKQPRTKDEDGEWREPEEQSLNAKPEIIDDDAASESSASSAPSIDPEDPMRDYLLSQRKEKKALQKPKKTKGKHKKDETPEERRIWKERKKERKARKSKGMRGVEELLNTLGARGGIGGPPSPSHSPTRRSRSRSRSHMQDHHLDRNGNGSRSLSPGRGGYERRTSRYDGSDGHGRPYERESRSRRRDYD